MKKNLTVGDRIIDNCGQVGTVVNYVYPSQIHLDGYIWYTLDDGIDCYGSASGVRQLNQDRSASSVNGK